MKTMSSSTERGRKLKEKLKNDEKMLKAYQQNHRERKAEQAKERASVSKREKALSKLTKTHSGAGEQKSKVSVQVH